VLLGTYGERPVLAIIATTGVVFAAVYGLRALQRVLFDRLDGAPNRALADLSRRELAVMSIFAVGIVWMGVAPAPVLTRIDRVSRSIVEAARFGPNAAPAQASLSPSP